MEQIVDVVVEMKNGHYIKCKRVDGSTPLSSNIGPNDYGYECGHDIFSLAIVQMSANLALSKKFGNKLYHIPYQGPLYWPEIKFSIYPISRDENQHHAGKKPENTYFVVIGPAGEVIDVVAELVGGDFIKCVITTKVPPEIDSDKDLRFGYLCGFKFFSLDHMRQTARFAKARKLEQSKQTYPKKFDDDSFKGYMYPLFPNGRFYKSGSVSGPTKHFIFMDLEFNLKFAAMKTKTE
ncbi:hypothetical protein EPUL_005759, partial [Erysiphe pulchra]